MSINASDMAWGTLSHQTAEDLEALQNKKLKFFARHYLPFSPFYREYFQKNNLSFSDIQSLRDLEKLPLVGKTDLIPTDETPTKPRQFILQPDADSIKQYYPKTKLAGLLLRGKKKMHELLETEFKPIHIHFTTGRSAAQIPFLYTKYDLELLGEVGRRVFDVAGLSKDDIMVNAFPFAPHLAFWLAQRGAETVGVRALHTGGGKIMGTEKIINAIEKSKATLMTVIPGYGYHLLHQAMDEKRDMSSLKTIIVGGERVSPGLREKIQSWLPGVRILSTYALTESKTAWIQCHEQGGYHLYPDLEYVELVDTEGRRVPDGTRGEVVYTALDWRGSIVMRYRTGDICEGMMREPCRFCGRTVPQLHYDIQRVSEVKELRLTKLKGELVNLNEFYKIIPAIKEIDEWQVEIRKKNNDEFEVDELHINIACIHGETCDTCHIIVDQKVTEVLGISPVVNRYSRPILLESLGLEKELKEKRMIDNRQ